MSFQAQNPEPELIIENIQIREENHEKTELNNYHSELCHGNCWQNWNRQFEEYE